MPSKRKVRLDQIGPGPIRHEEIPQRLLRVVRWTHRHLGHRVEPIYERWELGFLRDINIAQEIAAWIKMTWAFLEFLKRHPDHDRDAVYRGVVAISVGQTPKELDRTEADELQQLTGNPPPELADPSNLIFDS